MSHPVSIDEQREAGLSLEIIGCILLFFDFLILFFLPAGWKLGQQAFFGLGMSGVAALGVALLVAGVVVRLRAR